MGGVVADMGYRCPVCEDPQADDVHLANHLAFTALVRGGHHEDWLDEHVPDWGEMGEEGLANHVREHAESAEYPAVFEDTTEPATGQQRGGGHGHDHAGERDHPDGHDHAGERDNAQGGPSGWTGGSDDRPEMVDPPFGGGMDEETREAIERARELTRRRRENAADDPTEEEQ
jgi:hypothetical protein